MAERSECPRPRQLSGAGRQSLPPQYHAISIHVGNSQLGKFRNDTGGRC